jgi:3-deoxy-manno-octulosonate cytidylyltransferase (CMP-KDO synthetase)
MIAHVYRRAASTPGVDLVMVATDDSRIAEAIERDGGQVRLTDRVHPSGTDRVAEVARTLANDIVINLQGDLPLIDPEMIGDVLRPLVEDPSVRMSTLRTPLASDDEWTNPNVVKVVSDRSGDALYFSRSPLPFWRQAGVEPAVRGYRHIGLYGYRRDVLLTLAALPPTPLEMAESLEQLRALEHGIRIRVVDTRCQSIEVDTLEDLERVRVLVQSAAWKLSPEAHATAGSPT